jgi:predicted cation transporter
MDLQQMSKAGDDFSQDSLVTLIYSRMMAESKVVEVLAGVLVSLGLIGTIVGLIDMTGGLSDALASLGQDSDTTGLLTGMRSSMAGLGTAFNTTLVGAILGSVAVRILNSVYTTNVDHLVSYVASTAEVSIIPRLKQDFRLGADDEVA